MECIKHATSYTNMFDIFKCLYKLHFAYIGILINRLCDFHQKLKEIVWYIYNCRHWFIKYFPEKSFCFDSLLMTIESSVATFIHVAIRRIFHRPASILVYFKLFSPPLPTDFWCQLPQNTFILQYDRWSWIFELKAYCQGEKYFRKSCQHRMLAINYTRKWQQMT